MRFLKPNKVLIKQPKATTAYVSKREQEEKKLQTLMEADKNDYSFYSEHATWAETQDDQSVITWSKYPGHKTVSEMRICNKCDVLTYNNCPKCSQIVESDKHRPDKFKWIDKIDGSKLISMCSLQIGGETVSELMTCDKCDKLYDTITYNGCPKCWDKRNNSDADSLD